MTINTKRLVYPFAYYGGKVRLFPWIVENLPPALSFVDLYGGSGVVALNVVYQYKRVVYNDLNSDIVNFFWVLREFPDELISKITLTPCSRDEHARSHEETEDPIESARRTFVRIIQSYGQIGTKNSKSGWILPQKQGNRTSSILSRVNGLGGVVDRLREMEIENRPAMTLIEKESRSDTLLFADPPYVHSSRNARHGYAFEMSDEDHAAMCEAFNRSKANVVLCGYENEVYNDLLRGWHVVKKEVVSTAAASKRGKKTNNRVECLWIKR
ncbi:MAG: DNA adenine methylase [Gammaproteobacteria bacterium AqS3]|nr:DNA adenine methylase [Gammaproteobacteria bacterium AqS3]